MTDSALSLAAAPTPPLVFSEAEDEAAPTDRQAWAQVWDGFHRWHSASQIQVHALPVCCKYSRCISRIMKTACGAGAMACTAVKASSHPGYRIIGACLEMQAADAFDSTECVGQMIPRWVAEAVLRARLPHVPQLKCAFILYPAEARLPACCETDCPLAVYRTW